MDEWVLERIAGGEHGALGELAGRHEAAMLGLARGLLGGSTGLAEEAVQDAWVRVLARASSFNGSASVKTWLFRIVINRCRDIAKRERRRLRGESNAPPAGDRADAQDAGEQSRALAKAVMRLPTAQREAVLLCHHRGLTHAEAAAVLGIPAGTLKGRVRAGLTQLRRKLGTDNGVTP